MIGHLLDFLKHPPTLDPQGSLGLAVTGTALLFWFVTYLLIIRRSYKDRAFGMPASAICINLVIEGLQSFHLPLPPAAAAANMFSFFPDLLILLVCFLYGPADFKHPFVTRYYRVMLVAGLAMGLVLVLAFIQNFHDVGGNATTLFGNLLISYSLISLVLRRGSVQGQSAYIALFILIGNLFCYPVWLMLPMPEPRTPPLFGNAAFLFILVGNVLYLLLVIRQCKAEGIRPWRRL